MITFILKVVYILFVSRIGIEENVDQIWQCNPRFSKNYFSVVSLGDYYYFIKYSLLFNVMTMLEYHHIVIIS